MRPFEFAHADTPATAIRAQHGLPGEATDAVNASGQYLAGGTTLIDLMKLDVMRPAHVIDINGLHATKLGRIEPNDRGLTLGALVRMADAEAHPVIRKQYPALSQALYLAASAQIRNMASLGGNVLQRTRCTYFRDVSYTNCNKRNPGSGCAALEGFNRSHAVLGASAHCIATYAGDFAHALIALDADVDIEGSRGVRRIAFAKLHREPGDTPNVETTLAPGELITAFHVPATPWFRRSLFLKIRDRESYEFALASAVVALNLDGETVKDARIALGGVSTKPWRAQEAERAVAGRRLDDETMTAAADAAFANAKPREHNAFKIELGKRTLVRALQQAAALEI